MNTYHYLFIYHLDSRLVYEFYNKADLLRKFQESLGLKKIDICAGRRIINYKDAEGNIHKYFFKTIVDLEITKGYRGYQFESILGLHKIKDHYLRYEVEDRIFKKRDTKMINQIVFKLSEDCEHFLIVDQEGCFYILEDEEGRWYEEDTLSLITKYILTECKVV
jgi:hypothetical protein